MKNPINKSDKGITLAALIITIIILLILAVVSINAVQGDGIISYAKKARDDFQNAQEKENEMLSAYISQLKNANGTLKSYSEASRDTNGYLTENAIYTDGESKTATIPSGFKVSEVSTEKTIKTGLVVIDKAENEFVWVPVDTISEMAQLQDGSTINYEGKLYDINNQNWTGREPDTLSYNNYDGTTEYLEKAGITESANQNITYFKNQMQTEFNSMVKSVSKYKGFYVARYELSTTSEGKLASKAGATVITAETNNNMWYGLYNLCKTYNETSSVQSNMIYGCQYDAMMRWMQSAGIDVTSENIIGVSYNASPTLTGWYNSEEDKDNDVLNNVYDLLGGHGEWTQEVYSTNIRPVRGGYYCNRNNASARTTRTPNESYDFHSSRPTLYIK